MAVEPRCLIIQDVDTNEIVHLPVEIKEGKIVEQTQLISSILILDIDRLMSIRVDIHLAFYLDTAAHPRHKKALIKSQTYMSSVERRC